MKANHLYPVNSAEVEEEYFFPEDGKKPLVDKPQDGKKYSFAPGDKVYLVKAEIQNREGPYLVEKPENGKYTLCDENGNTVNGGEMVEEKDLVSYNHFA